MTDRAIPAGALPAGQARQILHMRAKMTLPLCRNFPLKQILRARAEMMFAAVTGTPRAAQQNSRHAGAALTKAKAVLAKKETKVRHFNVRKGGYRAVGGNDIGPSDQYGRIGRTDIYSSQEAFDLYRKLAFDKRPPL